MLDGYIKTKMSNVRIPAYNTLEYDIAMWDPTTKVWKHIGTPLNIFITT